MDAFMQTDAALKYIRRVTPPRGGLILKEVSSLQDIPDRFFSGGFTSKAPMREQGSALYYFLKDKNRLSARCYGVYFGRFQDDALLKKFVNFAVFAVDRYGVHHGFLSKRPFTEGGRHTSTFCEHTRGAWLWCKLRFSAFRMGRMALFVKRVYEHILSPDGPAFERARLRFEEHCAEQELVFAKRLREH